MISRTNGATYAGENGHSEIEVIEDGLLIHQHLVANSEVAAHFKVVDPTTYTRELDRIISIGTLVVEGAGPILDAGQIRREMEAAAQANAKASRDEVSAALEPVLKGDGPFMGELASVKAALKRHLDPEQASNIFLAIETTVKGVVARALDPDEPTGPLGRVMKRIMALHDEQAKRDIDLHAKLAGYVERREERQSSTRKGVEYEQLVFEEIARIAELNGDSFEAFPDTPGEMKPARRGDGVVTIHPALTMGEPVRMVFEAGDRAQCSQPELCRELDGAKANRGAVVGIGVLPNPDLGALRHQRIRTLAEGRFACVLNKEAIDPTALEAAYLLAKIEALRLTRPESREDDAAAKVQPLLEKALRQLDRLDATSAQFKKAREGLSGAQDLVGDTRAEVRATLNEAAALLANGPADGIEA